MATNNYPEPAPFEWVDTFGPESDEAIRNFRADREMRFDRPLTTVDVSSPAPGSFSIRSSFDVFMTKERALSIQWQQLGHYEKQWPGICRMVVGMTTDHLLRSGVEYPIDVINKHIPRGGAIEAIWARRNNHGESQS